MYENLTYITVKMSCAIQTIDGQQRENFCRIHICWLSDLPSLVGIIGGVVGVAVGAAVGVAVEAIQEEGRRNARLNNLNRARKKVYLSTFNSAQPFLNIGLPH